MPLNQGTSKEAVSENIATEIRSGRDPAQAKAIALNVARKNGARIPVKPRPNKALQQTGGASRRCAVARPSRPAGC